jgi:hypothetical protein
VTGDQREVFHYTIADSDGDTDTAELIIDIGATEDVASNETTVVSATDAGDILKFGDVLDSNPDKLAGLIAGTSIEGEDSTASSSHPAGTDSALLSRSSGAEVRLITDQIGTDAALMVV